VSFPPRRLIPVAAVAAAITALLYARSLALPFYSDDLVQIPWLRALSRGALWTQVSPYGYYRPLAFSFWLLIRDLGLPWTPAGLRWLNLIGHALAATLVGRLTIEIDPGRRTLTSAFAAGLFAAYPFAYQAVPWVSAFFYPLVAVLTLVAVIAYLHARATGSWCWMVISLAATALAPFAHENGMLVGLLVALTELLIRTPIPGLRPDSPLPSLRSDSPSPPLERGPGGEATTIVLWPLAHVAIGAAFAGLWFSLQPGGVTTLDLTLRGLADNIAILSTGLSYPAAPLASFLRSTPGAPTPMILSWGILLLVLGTLFLPMRRAPRVMLFCLGWFALSVSPALVTMRSEWLIDAPRFLYPAGVGAAIAWGLAASPVASSREAQLKSILAALALVLPGAYFAYQGVGWHLRGGVAIGEAMRAAQAKPGDSLLLVNLPDRLTPHRSFYPFFPGGAILLPSQVEASNVIGAATGELRQDKAITVGHILPPVIYQRTTYGPLVEGDALAELLMEGCWVEIAVYEGETIQLREAGRIRERYTPPRFALAYFESALVLWQAEARVEGRLLRLALIWEITAPLDGSPTVFVHIVDDGGSIAGQADGDPIGGLYPLGTWRGHMVLEDVRHATLPGDGPYTVYVGVWRPSTGERLVPAGGDYPDNRVPVARIGP